MSSDRPFSTKKNVINVVTSISFGKILSISECLINDLKCSKECHLNVLKQIDTIRKFLKIHLFLNYLKIGHSIETDMKNLISTNSYKYKYKFIKLNIPSWKIIFSSIPKSNRKNCTWNSVTGIHKNIDFHMVIWTDINFLMKLKFRKEFKYTLYI